MNSLSDNELLVLAEMLESEARKEGVTKFIAGAAIIRDGGVLIIRRLSTESLLPNYWELPSGGAEYNDSTIIDTLKREVLEETGLTIDSIKTYLGYFDYKTIKHAKVRQWNFLVEVKNSEITLSENEHDAYRTVININDIPIKISNESKKTVETAIEEIKTASKNKKEIV
ncbi:NUDIX hydrolase [Agrobacterium pusense]|uniref:NUDIX hydrolase n=1 Tax=Agrobacterium pusense TaxID=648995 RepID=UPI0011518E7F